MAFELQTEKDFEKNLGEFFYEVAPPVLIFVVSIFGGVAAGAVGGVAFGLVFEAIMGFVDFVYEMHKAEKDGMITNKEAEEAWWNLIGILPFKLIQLGILARAVFQLSTYFLNLLLEALKDFWADIETLIASIRAGWDVGYRFDSSTTILIPDYAT